MHVHPHHRHPAWWHWHHKPYPAWWRQQASCIRSHEGWWTAATGNGYAAYAILTGVFDA